jgi:AcrR family transcriptional regulator
MARTRAAEIAREATRGELLGAALEVFGQKGYAATTISDIVGAAGVTQGTFYLYFTNKADIFSELLDEYRTSMITGLSSTDLKTVKTKNDWLKMADHVADFLVDHVETHGTYMRLFIAEAETIGSRFADRSYAFADGVIQEIGRMLSHGIRRGLLRKMDVDSIALSVFGALKEVVRQSCFQQRAIEPQEMIPRVIRSQARLVLK